MCDTYVEKEKKNSYPSKSPPFIDMTFDIPWENEKPGGKMKNDRGRHNN